MADPKIAGFLREHRGKFTLEQLRQGLLEQGVDPAELDAAIKEVSLDPERPKRRLWPWVAGGAAACAVLAALGLRGGAPEPPAAPEAGTAPPAAAAVDALAAARERYRKDFFDARSHMALSEALYRAGRVVDAYYVLEEARALFPEPEFASAHAELILEPAQAAAAASPHSAFVIEAFEHWSRGDLAAAKAMADQASSREPRHAGAAVIRGALAIQDKRFDDAVSWLKMALESDPDNAYANAKLAELHKNELRDHAGALPYYIALHHFDPHYNDGKFAAGRIRGWLEQRRQAELAGAASAAQLEPFLASPDGSLRAEACIRAAKLGELSLVGRLSELLDDDVGNVTQNADYALFELGKKDEARLLALRDALTGSPKTFVRGMSLNLYSDLSPADTLPIVIKGLNDPEPYVRFRAAGALGHYYARDAKAREALEAYRGYESDPKLRAVLERMDRKEQAPAPAADPLAALAGKDPMIAAMLKGATLLSARRYADASVEYEKALALAARGPKKADEISLGMLYSGLGDAYLFSERPDKAAEALREAAERLDGPSGAHARYNLACAYAVQRKLGEAEKALRAALQEARTSRLDGRFVAQAKMDAQLKNLGEKRLARILADFAR